jgi:hypothetical protein
MGQSPGTHWYHAHKHGSSTIDVSNGFSEFFTKCEEELSKGSHVEWPVTWDDLPKAYTDMQKDLLQRFDQQPEIGNKLWPRFLLERPHESNHQYEAGRGPDVAHPQRLSILLQAAEVSRGGPDAAAQGRRGDERNGSAPGKRDPWYVRSGTDVIARRTSCVAAAWLALEPTASTSTASTISP